ncbi:LysR substrate-binding domain-containing protein [Cohaesibacter celericrescens]|uniref:LysR substrate-binding domain-containing protein n=1 Tax=Cohaesibacter celericrescens TaxID=2067669 RepID=UPI003563EC05
MVRKLPPFSAVKAFEAAARYGSFSRAAHELDVTPTAVSQHVKGLEHWLGESLFLRRANGVKLTEKGADLLGRLSRILDDMAILLPPERTQSDAISLTIAMAPALADGWLLPRLSDFYAKNPGIVIDVKTAEKSIPLSKNGDVDFVIGTKEAMARDVLSDFLFEDTLQPVCTLQYRDLLGLQDPHNWKSVTLLHDALCEGDWSNWAAQNASPERDWTSGLRYPNQWLAVEAAKQARGLLIARSLSIAQALQEGFLVSLTKTPMPTGRSYYLMRRRGHANPAAVQFRAWLLTNMRIA